MNGVVEFINQNQKSLITVGILIVVFLIICFFKQMIKKSQKRKEIKRAAEDRVRDENLNSIILNNHGNAKDNREIYKPYDVDYSNGEQGNVNKNRSGSVMDSQQIMIQLIEKTELSTRKFLLNPAKKIKIGSDLQNNDISVLAEGISPHQCEIFAVGNKVYIRNTGDKYKTIIRRKKEQAFVDDKGIRLLSNDIIILGKVTYDVTIAN